MGNLRVAARRELSQTHLNTAFLLAGDRFTVEFR